MHIISRKNDWSHGNAWKCHHEHIDGHWALVGFIKVNINIIDYIFYKIMYLFIVFLNRWTFQTQEFKFCLLDARKSVDIKWSI